MSFEYRQQGLAANVIAHLKPNYMKQHFTFLTLILIVFSIRSQGQLIVNAGNDTILCFGTHGIDTTIIGGNPTASGGIEPYSYSWSANFKIGSHSYGASYFLDDTTLANPRLISSASKDLKLKLVVTDNIGAQNEDSITIGISTFLSLAMDCIEFINQGDTASLWGDWYGGIGPLSYTWSPNYNISDTTAASPKAWPDTTVAYSVFKTDSIGCVSRTSICSIYVNTTGTNSINYDLENSIVCPNPIDNNSIITVNKDITKDLIIYIVNSIGQTILMDKISLTSFVIGDKIFNKGIYFYVIMDETNIISHGRFIKE